MFFCGDVIAHFFSNEKLVLYFVNLFGNFCVKLVPTPKDKSNALAPSSLL